MTFHNMLVFYDEDLSALYSTSKLDDHPFLTVCYYLSTIYLQLPSAFGVSLLHPQPEDMPYHGDRDLFMV